MKRLFLFLLFVLSGSAIYAQNQAIIDFESPSLPGPQMDYTQTIDTGDYYFDYFYQDPWGDYNRYYGRKNTDSSYEGFTYSNVRDSVTPGIINDRAAFPAIGHNGSAQYGMGHGTCGMHASAVLGVKPTIPTYVFGMYITNSTYDVLSMENGDSTAKKFGGTTGNDPDWFLLTIKGYYHQADSGVLTDSVLFYLADFRSDTPAMDYIVKDWTWMDLSSLGGVDSLSFSLSSSDTNLSGAMNTPAYFCMDDMGVQGEGDIDEIYCNSLFKIYPNPVNSGGMLYLDNRSGVSWKRYELTLYDLAGKAVLKKGVNAGNAVSLPLLPPGIYSLLIRDDNKRAVYNQKLNVR